MCRSSRSRDTSMRGTFAAGDHMEPLTRGSRRRRCAIEGVQSHDMDIESDVVLADGGTVHLCPMTRDDEAALLEFYEAMTDESVYLRFFSPLGAARAVQLERASQGNDGDHASLVAELGGKLIAVARYDRVGPHEAEVAFTVRDDEQGRGLATMLLEHLAAIARQYGITVFSADMLPIN